MSRILSETPDEARVWIYGAVRELRPPEVRSLEQHMDRFIDEWRSHGHEIAPAWTLVHNRFLVVGVDETAMALSGCSIDSMFRAVEAFGQRTGLDFSRSGGHVFYRGEDGAVRRVDRLEFSKLARGHRVSPDTRVFDNTIATVGDLRSGRWEVPLKDSWHMRAFSRSLSGARSDGRDHGDSSRSTGTV